MGSISSWSSSGTSSKGASSEGASTDVGFHVAAEGIILEPSGAIPGAITRPSSLNVASASAAAAAIAFARSSLNCFRSARRFAVISSDVSPMAEKFCKMSKIKQGKDIPLPFIFLAFICLANQLGSLLDRLPFPKNPRRHSVVASPEFETQAERVIGSNSAVQCGLRGRVKERPRNVYVGSGKIIGRGWAYILAVSARREEGLKDALEREVGLMSDMDEVTFGLIR
jgi:hypothetical protein